MSKVSCCGSERVLALADTPSVLKKGDVWRLLHAGAADVFDWVESANPAREIAIRLTRWTEVDEIVKSSLVRENLIGHSRIWNDLLRQIVEVARFSEASILITGESGTGKELIARLIHTLDARPDKGELVVLDCTTIVPELAGSEFFGHERGAFTGAIVARDGAFALANGGTLFLDEVGDLPRTLQAQLLRVIQEHTYKRVGGNQWCQSHFRLLCATNKDLTVEVKEGRFRADLYYRIADWTIRLPPLRDRTEDIPLLARHFIQAHGHHRSDFNSEVTEYLLSRDYPGNVRDLKQVVARMSHRHVGQGEITVGAIPPTDRPQAESPLDRWSDRVFELPVRHSLAVGVGLKEIGRIAEETAVQIALAEEGGNLQRAARRLKVSDRALQLRQANGRGPKEAPSDPVIEGRTPA